MSALEQRRGFLRGLVSLPLIGGGVTLIGRAAAQPMPIVEAMAAAPTFASPRERARYAWAAFSSAMRDLTADAHGWVITGAGERKPYRNLEGGAFLNVQVLHYLARH